MAEKFPGSQPVISSTGGTSAGLDQCTKQDIRPKGLEGPFLKGTTLTTPGNLSSMTLCT